jgi:thiol:disulfide interchange protein
MNILKASKKYLIAFGLILAAYFIIGCGIRKTETADNQENKKETVTDKKKTEATEVVWHNMTEGYSKAKKEKKLLLVDVYTDWCYWCKVMDKYTYTNKNIIQKMSDYVVAVKFNPEKNEQHIVESDTLNSYQLSRFLAKGGRIPGYPSTFIWKDFTKSSDINAYSGYMDSTQLNEVLNKRISQ